MKLLLSRGADINVQSGRAVTALHAALENDHGHIVELLLDNGADTNVQGEEGPALLEASLRGQEQFVKLLLDKGADVDAQVDSTAPRFK